MLTTVLQVWRRLARSCPHQGCRADWSPARVVALLVVVALPMTGMSRLALASGSWGTELEIVSRLRSNDFNWVFGRSGGKQSSRNRAAGKIRAAASSTTC